MPRKFFPAFVLVLLLLALTSQLASAHATLISADPAPNALVPTAPQQITLSFDEPIDLAFSSIQVLDQTQARFETGSLAFASQDRKKISVKLKVMPDSTYTVAWKVLSAADGHLTRGNYAFSVGKVTASVVATNEPASAESAPFSVFARWLELFSLLTLIGAIFFRDAVLTYSLRTIGADPGLANARWMQLVRFTFVIALVATFLRLALQIGLVTDTLDAQTASQVLFNSRYGILWLGRVVLLVVLAWFIFRPHEKLRALPLVPGIFLLLMISLGGHATAQGDFSFAIFADWLHLTAVSFWVGGLGALVWVAAMVWGALQDRARAWLGVLIPRFSFVALVSVGVILITGLYASTQQVPSLDALWQTIYGRSLAIKIALFLVMTALGGFHLTVTTKRLNVPKILRDFRALIALEAAIGALVIAFAGFMTLSVPARATILAAQYMQPPQSKPSGLLLFARPSSDIQLTLNALTEGAVLQKFDALVLDASKQPAKNVLRVIYEFTLLDQDVGVTRVNVDIGSQGHYTTSGNYLTFPGLWRVRVIVRRASVDDIAAEFPIYREGPNPTTNDFKAMDLFQQADAAMNRLKSVRTVEELNDGENSVVVTRSEFAAPDRMHTTVEGGNEIIVIGTTQYFRDESGWTSLTRPTPYKFPTYNNAGLSSGIKFGRTEIFDGKPTQVVIVDFTSSAGDVRYAYWVGTEDRLIRQYAMVAPAHFMMERYRDFDAPVAINAPTNLSTAQPNAPSTVTATPAPRVGGPITGDLQSDLALGVLVVSLVIGLRATDRARARLSRLMSGGLAMALAIAALLLFNDAINAAYKQFANVPIDVKQAASGKILYEQNCLACHGETGYGNGPAAKSLKVQPFDLTVHAFHHDETFFISVMTNGRGEMPAFKGKLTTAEMLNLVQYIRQLGRDAQADR